MKVLLATDASDCADVALELASGLAWPADTTIRVAMVVPASETVIGMAWAPPVAVPVDELDADLLKDAEAVLARAAGRLARPGLTVERAVLRGRAGSAIVADAESFSAELIVMGSRGHGEIASMLLGSVSAEVVDHAPCPVLVARTSKLERLVLADDGSAFARAAERVVAEWPIFAPVAVEVVSVVPPSFAWQSGLAAVGPSAEGLEQAIRADMNEHQHVVEEAAQRLARAGHRAGTSVVEGQPAAELIRVAADRGADLIVLGTHGRTGLARLLLGSVARNVLLHASTSVLIVRATGSAQPAAGA